ncbi:DNA polymerase III subunit delta [Candidatus Pelagibacter sp.]|nr:DNA polymerase III subunit delta [Candidatus Pelagibacter sp.]
MIVKHFELDKNISVKNKFFLLYGNNSGLIKEIIKSKLKPFLYKKVFNYDEGEIINNLDSFKEEILNKSFFENEKLVIISRSTDKVCKIIEEIIEKKVEDLAIILTSGALEKKSKLRNLFEKNKDTICIPFYEDNERSLVSIIHNFLKEKKIQISNESINLLIQRCSGDRINLYNELKKIESFSKNRKKIDIEDIAKLTNLSENLNFNELVDNVLAKNLRKTLYILNENNFASEDAILILRIFLIKLKRLLKIKSQIKIENNVENAIKNFKPPIFWKEKEILKKQVGILSYQNIKDLIVKTNNLELIVKKNPSISINLITNFIIEQGAVVNN